MKTMLARVAISMLCAITYTGASAADLDQISSVTAGRLHSCALSISGSVQCWGYGSSGQLGDGALSYRAYAADVPGLDATAIDAGGYHTCAVTRSGGVRCWGENADGQLGDGTTTRRSIPVEVQGLETTVVGVSAGYAHSCALMATGGVKCWGANGQGQLGNNTQSPNRFTPVDVTELQSGAVAVVAGDAHTCAALTNGGVKCWGNGDHGQIGAGSRIGATFPVTALQAGTGVVAISAGGSHTCAITAAHVALCWGANNFGQIGDGTTIDALTPVVVQRFETGIKAIGAGLSHTCGVSTSGAAFCWGQSAQSQLGSFLTATGIAFQVLNQTSGVVSIAAAATHTCEVTTEGKVKCWGQGALTGNGRHDFTGLPVSPVTLGSGIVSVAAGFKHNCAIDTVGHASCWGENSSGQLGDGTPFPSMYPIPVRQANQRYTSLAAGSSHTCGLTSAGAVKCWGSTGQLGGTPSIGNPVGAAVDVVGLSNVTAIAAGAAHTCALVSDGSVHCWGSNFVGQLGDNSTDSRIPPVTVAGLTNAIAIATGPVHSCAITSAGALLCWGGNNQGQLGDGTLAFRVTPLTIIPSGVRMVAAGSDRTCIVTDAGAVRCWGSNAFLQLGNGTTGGAVTGLNGAITKLVAGFNHTCVIIDGRRVQCWGSDVYGELGDNRTASLSGVPTNVLGLEDGVLSLAAGQGHTCAVLSSGAVRCWGADLAGQLGDGHATFIAPPVNVVVPDRPSVIEFYNPILDHYFVTAGVAEAQAIDRGDAGPGWSRTGLKFKSGGDVPVCRFYGSALPPGPNSHFFAFDGSECEGLRNIDVLPGDVRRGSVKSWHFEGFAFSITVPTIIGCPAFTMPVYRAYNNGSVRGVDSNHRLTTDVAATREMVARGWVDEGVVMCAPN